MKYPLNPKDFRIEKSDIETWYLERKQPFIDPQTGTQYARERGELGDFFWDPVFGLAPEVCEAAREADVLPSLVVIVVGAMNVAYHHGEDDGRVEMQKDLRKLIGV